MSRRCNFKHPRFEDGQCPRPARRAWTMCNSHYSAGRSAKPLHLSRDGRMTFCGINWHKAGERIKVAHSTDQVTCDKCVDALDAWRVIHIDNVKD